MADTKLFNIKGTVKEYQSGTVTLEKELQTVIENNMNIFFGVTFLASEYRTTDGGRMDSIGISMRASSTLLSRRRYRSMMAVSKETPLRRGIWSVTSPEVVVRFRS